MTCINGGEDRTITRTIIGPDGKVTVITITIKDDGRIIIDRIENLGNTGKFDNVGYLEVLTP